MQFSVITTDGRNTYDGTYKVLNNGVLQINPEDGSEQVIRMSPAFWWQINEPREPSEPYDPDVVGFH